MAIVIELALMRVEFWSPLNDELIMVMTICCCQPPKPNLVATLEKLARSSVSHIIDLLCCGLEGCNGWGGTISTFFCVLDSKGNFSFGDWGKFS
jgi:hypothetical protein